MSRLKELETIISKHQNFNVTPLAKALLEDEKDMIMKIPRQWWFKVHLRDQFIKDMDKE